MAVVVGATGAFGRQIVARLCASNLDAVAVARSAESLGELAGLNRGLIPCVADTASDDAVAAIRAVLDRPVRIVVHGPGVVVIGGILDAPTAALVDSVNIKVGGLLRLTRVVDERLVKGSRLVAIGGHYGFEPTAYAALPGLPMLHW